MHSLQAQVRLQLPWIFFGFALVIALILLGKWLFDYSVEPFYEYLAKSALQLAIIVIIGGLLKILIDWRADMNERQREKFENRKEFLRRVRAVHVRIRNAQVLMIAYRNHETWGEQMRNLIAIKPEVEEITMDLEVSTDMFKKKGEILEGLKGINEFLQVAEKEYISRHTDVDQGFQSDKRMEEIITEKGMAWTADFIAQSGNYQVLYYKSLTKSKWNMRKEIYGKQ